MMKFEDLPESVQQTIINEMLHEEPSLNAEAARELLTETREQSQQRFDKTQAEAAGVPLDFVQLYSKVEAEIDAFADGKQGKEVVAAAAIQLVSHYCAAATEGRIRDQGEEIEKLRNAVSNRDETIRAKERRISEQRRDMDVMRAGITAMMDRIQCTEYDVRQERIVRPEKIITLRELPALQLTRIRMQDND
ncbi:hypothetical protein SONNY_45 [Arthrobacter phage Sonny]|uniref:Uncharacterized protein n=1 Tax=Arthrobacter phage Sonny TaxID=1772315 RepID=A0A0U3TMM5_9CAUD|nr:hypothetical protein FDH50_gp45 [Arthrobacter phage Sonny]ALY10313.1 hypothetical protein SONNY_45 [Arthrobacter phage Sonny]